MSGDLSLYTVSNCTKAVTGRALRVTRTGAAPYIQSPALKAEIGRAARYMWVRAVKLAGGAPGANWVGSLKYARSGVGAHGISSSFRCDVAAPVGRALGDTIDLYFDMWALTAGGTDWKDGTIDQWRLEIDNDPGAVWDFYLATPANPPGTINLGALADLSAVDTAEIANFAVTGQSLSTATPADYTGAVTVDICTVTVTTVTNDIIGIYAYSEIGSKAGPVDAKWSWDMVRYVAPSTFSKFLRGQSILQDNGTVPYQDDANGLPQQFLVYDTPGPGTWIYKLRATPGAPYASMHVFNAKLLVTRIKR